MFGLETGEMVGAVAVLVLLLFFGWKMFGPKSGGGGGGSGGSGGAGSTKKLK